MTTETKSKGVLKHAPAPYIFSPRSIHVWYYSNANIQHVAHPPYAAQVIAPCKEAVEQRIKEGGLPEVGANGLLTYGNPQHRRAIAC